MMDISVEVHELRKSPFPEFMERTTGNIAATSILANLQSKSHPRIQDHSAAVKGESTLCCSAGRWFSGKKVDLCVTLEKKNK